MKAGSAIILNASIATSRGNPAGSIYGASRRQCVRWHAPSAPNSSAGHLRQRHQSRPDRDADLRPLRNERRAQAELKAAWAARKPMKRFGSVD